MNPTIKRQVESVRYMAHTMIPGLALAYVKSLYLQTGDSRALSEMNFCAERLKLAVGKYHPNRERVPKLLEEIDEGVKVIKERY